MVTSTILTGPAGGTSAGIDIRPEILASIQRHGFVGLTYYDSGARSIYNSVRPDRKSTRLNSSHIQKSRMPSSA